MSLQPDPIALVKELIAIPSQSGDETRLAALIAERADQLGLPVEQQGRNLVIRIGTAGGKKLLLSSHLDTVAPVAGWHQDPFTPRLDSDRIIGLGANDAKGSVAAMLCAVAGCSNADLSGQVVLALTVDEEVGGGDGLVWLIDWLGPLDAAVIGEPTGLAICRSQKGLLILEVITSGDARHAAHAHRLPGRNAIVEAAQAIAKLAAWEPGYEHHLLGPVTCQLTTIAGGSRRNVVPDRCSFTLDIRTIEGVATEEIVRRVGEVCGAEVRVFSDRMRPVETAVDAGIVRAACRARPQSRVVGSATMSDAVWTRHLPTVKVGPGATERSHTAGEYITVAELQEGAAFYQRLIKEYFSLIDSEEDERQ
jgi:acetylornithine deacetylase